MKRNIKRMVAIFGVVLTVVCSVAPSYYVYAEDPAQEPASQEVTSDDNIIQKLFYYSMSAIGALDRTSTNIRSLPTTIANNVKETLASLMNGGGIYVDSNGDYVFTDDACNSIYQAMNNNSEVDANVITNFNNFTYNTDGYINSTYITGCNALTSYYNIEGSGMTDNVNGGTGTSGKYMLMCFRSLSESTHTYNQTIQATYTTTVCAFDIGNVAFISMVKDGDKYLMKFFDSSSNPVNVPWGYNACGYYTNGTSYVNNTQLYAGTISYFTCPVYYMWYWTGGGTQGLVLGGQDYYRPRPNIYIYDTQSAINGAFNSFPNFETVSDVAFINSVGSNNGGGNTITLQNTYFYSSNALIFAKTPTGGSSEYNKGAGIYYSKFENNVVNKTVLENNNWENIYNSYIQNVNIDYQKDPSITTSDFRKILKKYTGSVIDAIESGSSSIEETVSISNRYLQAISTDVRSISEKIDNMTNEGSGGGMTEEQYNSIMSKLNDINDNAIDIASSTATISSDIDAIYEDTHGISSDMAILLENTGDTNTNLVAIDTLLQQINNKLRNRRTDNPLPDPDFWDNLDDELDDYTNTMMEDLIFKLQMIGTVLQGVVPFGYLVVLNVMINALAEEPEEPVFEIDLQSNGATAIPVNWQGTIDLSWVGDIMPIVRSFEVILFIIGLIWATFNVFTALGSLL